MIFSLVYPLFILQTTSKKHTLVVVNLCLIPKLLSLLLQSSRTFLPIISFDIEIDLHVHVEILFSREETDFIRTMLQFIFYIQYSGT